MQILDFGDTHLDSGSLDLYRVSQKNHTLFWRAVAPLNLELGIKVGGVLESSGSQLFKTVPTFDF